MSRFSLLAVLVLAGCGRDKSANKLMETGWFIDTGSFDAGNCKARFGASNPANGTDDWYYRSTPSFWVERADPDAYSVKLVDDEGVPAPVEPTWTEDGLNMHLVLTQPLKPSTDYRMTITDCANIHRIGFRTSAFGKPLDVSPDQLTGRTFLLDMLGANWVRPGGAEALIQLYFSQPALLGVRQADTLRIDVIGAPGGVDPFGGLLQSSGSTWDFPTADFKESPYFESNANKVIFQFQGIEIPMHNTRLAGTFSADGLRIGGGELSGLGDTRDLGEFLPNGGSNQPDAICNLAESLGIECEDCPDGQPYCMQLEATELDGTFIEGLTLVPRN